MDKAKQLTKAAIAKLAPADQRHYAVYLYMQKHNATMAKAYQAVYNCGPEYAVEAVGEDAGLGPFRATVTWCGILLGTAEGPSKHKAEMAAAKEAMEHRRWENR